MQRREITSALVQVAEQEEEGPRSVAGTIAGRAQEEEEELVSSEKQEQGWGQEQGEVRIPEAAAAAAAFLPVDCCLYSPPVSYFRL